METECRDMCGSEDLLKSFPLHRACRDGDLSTLSGLLGEAVVSVCDAATQDPLFGWTPAHWAAHNGKVECLEMFIKAGVPCDITTLGPGLTLAHVAALEGQTSCLTWLCKNGVSINAQDDMGETAAHKAVRCGSVECLHILQHHGADFSLHSSIGMTVLDVALQNQQTGCIEYFQAGGDVTNHMTCMNGRRKRMQASEEVEMDTAKRARLESEHASSSYVCSPKAILRTTTTIARHHIQHTTNGRGDLNGHGSKEIDQELAQDYATVVPCCQPVFSRRPCEEYPSYHPDSDMIIDEPENTAKNISHLKSGASSVHTMSNGASSFHTMSNGASSVHTVSNGASSVHTMSNGASSVHTMSNGASSVHTMSNGASSVHSMSNGASSVHTMSNGASSVHTMSNGTISVHTMSNGAMEHNQMVQQSNGYDITLEAMYSYDSPLCGHAY